MKDKIFKILILFVTVGLILAIGYFSYIIFGYSNVEYKKILIRVFVLLVSLALISEYFVSYYYPLLGKFFSSFSYSVIFVPIFFIFLISIFYTGFSNGLKEFVLNIICLLILGFLVVSSIKLLINCIKDFFIGKQEIIIKSYNISYKQNRKSPNYYILEGTDINNNKIELESRIKIVDNKNEIKIKYYENIKMIESFEYLEK